MNNFNLILSVIREHCKEVNVPSEECFEKVKEGLDGEGVDHLGFYLDFLQDLGLIKYNDDNKNIVLTERGKYTQQLFN